MRAKPFEAQATMVCLLLTQSLGCIEWPHSVNSRGYGQMGVAGKSTSVHVLACEHFHGPRPAGMQVAHSCGNKRCLNRAHIRWASPTENAADKVLHGTTPDGARNPNAKLTVTQVAAIRSSDAHALTLAREFGVSRRTIDQIRTGTSWRSELKAAS